MKKQVITIATIFMSILLLAMLFVAISPANIPEPQKNDFNEISNQPITFTTLGNTVTFTTSQIPQLSKILEFADIRAMSAEMYYNSDTIITIGGIDKYKFKYHYTIVDHNTKFHGITVLDTIDNHEVYIGRYNRFTEDLTTFRELFTDTTK
jgi:hypothetical protein